MSITYKVLVINNEDEELKEKYKNHSVNYMDDVGFDLFVPEDLIVPSKAVSFKIKLGIKSTGVRNNKKSSYMIFPRSSMGGKTPLRLANSIGLVDPNYTGELIAIVDNISDTDYKINRMDRLVQLVGPSHEQPSVLLVDELELTDRGEKGIGSSGR
tara:strand:+ start:122 stop:589 length:468 start_codon:yes stop_codon:yes gene_type:complete